MFRKVICYTVLLVFCDITLAGITATGDYKPTDLGSLTNEQRVEQIYAGAIPNRYGMISFDGSDIAASCNMLTVGGAGSGVLNIKNGAKIDYVLASIGTDFLGFGTMNVQGFGSKLVTANFGSMWVANHGTAEINVLNGGKVETMVATIANDSVSKANINISGQNSKFITSELKLGIDGLGYMNISDGGFVEAGQLTIGKNADVGSVIDMATGGQLKISGDVDDSIDEFLSLINGTGRIRYWDGYAWTDIAGASTNVYTLTHSVEYDSFNDRYDYTTLTVNSIPEPASILLLSVGCLALRKKNISD